MLVANVVVLGAVQLFAWLGDGLPDPNIPRLTVLQVVGFIASLIQLVAFVPSFMFQTEKYYDITGTLTYLTCIGYSLGSGYVQAVNRAARPIDIRAIVASCLVLVWAVRLGYFLFSRIMQDKKDKRFDNLKPDWIQFALVWNIQGLWVFLGCLPTFILNSTQLGNGFVWTDALGGALYGIGLLGEVVADHQKSKFNADPQRKGTWIDVGIWRYSRHPNYFFEWLLQFGLFVLCTAELQETQWVAIASPIFTAFLLAAISGVPMLERRADAKWGDDPEYQAYKRSVSSCIPFIRFDPDPEKKIPLIQDFLTWNIQ